MSLPCEEEYQDPCEGEVVNPCEGEVVNPAEQQYLDLLNSEQYRINREKALNWDNYGSDFLTFPEDITPESWLSKPKTHRTPRRRVKMALVNTSLLVNLRDNLQKQRVEVERAVRWRDQRIASFCASLSKEKELMAQSLRVQRSAETLLNSLKEHLP
ncbi:hypothetical protein GE061_008668 [Apolygus lucorum]|uniref:Uncharacterized protein n=1 Tax=Apolygus lucorum TaxID=248454 RepID=A0A8S9WKZ6_APOLU|nr:hypothetical protein GE061_008668 [Apolygus lucorum]